MADKNQIQTYERSEGLRLFDLLSKLRLRKGYIIHNTINTATGLSSLKRLEGWYK